MYDFSQTNSLPQNVCSVIEETSNRKQQKTFAMTSNNANGNCNARKNNLEDALIKVNKFINIDRDRQEYATHFTKLRDEIFRRLKEDDLFKSLSNGHYLQGSYADNLKVEKPNEFDLVFNLKIPESRRVKVEEDKQNVGNVHINLNAVLECIEKQKQHALKYKNLLDWITPNKRLNIDKIQAWLQGQFSKALLQMNYRFVDNNKTYALSYSRQGPAHTIDVKGCIVYSVDFVPAIQLDSNQAVAKGINKSWGAIPKPPKPFVPDSTSFRPSYFEQEQEIIKNNKNLKNVLRMMKKFRDSHKNMNNIKSYYIKMVFLLKAREKNAEYWSNSLSVLVVDMFDALKKCLLNRKLEYFWHSNVNLFKDFTSHQMNDMLNCVQGALNTLEIARNNNLDAILENRVFSIFLTTEEREKIVRGKEKSPENKEQNKQNTNKQTQINLKQKTPVNDNKSKSQNNTKEKTPPVKANNNSKQPNIPKVPQNIQQTKNANIAKKDAENGCILT